MTLPWFLIGLLVFWYAWWYERAFIERRLTMLCAYMGLGYSNTYKASVVVLVVLIFIFYGLATHR